MRNCSRDGMGTYKIIDIIIIGINVLHLFTPDTPIFLSIVHPANHEFLHNPVPHPLHYSRP